MKKKAICVFILSLFAVPCPAGPMYSTVGSGDTYDISNGVGTSSNIDLGNLFSFTGSQSYALNTIELAVSLETGSNVLDVWLMCDAGGEPGSLIEAFSFTDAMGSTGQDNPLLVTNSVLHPVLSPDTDYWIVVSVPDTTTEAAWMNSSPTASGTVAEKQGIGPWTISPNEILGALRVSGTPVPVPGVFVLGGMGLGLVGWLRRRRTL